MDKKQSEKIRQAKAELEKLKADDAYGLSGLFRFNSPKDVRSYFYRIKRLPDDKEGASRFALENIYSICRNSPHRLIYYLRGDGKEISLFLGVQTETDASAMHMGEILLRSFYGNLRGGILESAGNGEFVFRELSKPSNIFSVAQGIPSKESDSKSQASQSVDRVVHSMGGKNFHLVIVWESLPERSLWDMRSRLLSIYDKIAPLVSDSVQNMESHNKSTGNNGDSKGSSSTSTESRVDKDFAEWQKALDEEFLPRMNNGLAKGMYLTAVYLGAESDEDLALLESSLTNMFQANTPSRAPMFTRRLPASLKPWRDIARGEIYAHSCETPWLALRSRYLLESNTALGTILTAEELGFIAGLPGCDVPGLEIVPGVSFGVNVPAESRGLPLGRLLDDGGDSGVPVEISPSDLERHTFIAGTTGAGKTTTCRRLLREANCGFLVIEPAKTEYRCLSSDPRIGPVLHFTVGDETGLPFRMNPFEFLKDENISSHIDMLKACFMASFHLEAAMPNLMEEAMYRLYERFGWNISDNSNRILNLNKDSAWEDYRHGNFFPTISDYIKMVSEVVREKHFDKRLENDYIGSIRGRLESLTVGVKGRMLDTRRSIDFEWLLDQKVVLEMEELKSGDDKAFVMAIVIGRLLEALKARYRRDQKEGKKFRHVLLVEEAHRLLARPEFGDSSCKRLGVNIFADMLAEVRKYHECLVIVDQIPAKLAPEVLKNTNTKIIHRLYAEDDKRTIGEIMALSDEQRDFLSRLGTGEAIIYGNGWLKPVHAQISRLKEAGDSSELPRQNFWGERIAAFCPSFPARQGRNPTLSKLKEMCDIYKRLRKFFDNFENVSFQEWQEFLSVSRRHIGEYADDFFKCAIKDALFVNQIMRNDSQNVQGLDTLLENAQKALLSNDKKSFRHFKSNFC